MDSLSELVRLLAPSGTVDLHCRVAGAWSAFHDQAPPGHVPYHVILHGRAEVMVGRQQLHVAAGDVLLFPRGGAHTVSGMHAGTRRAEPSRHFNGVVTEVVVPGNAAPLDILCGTFVLGRTASVLLGAMPEVLRVQTAGAGDEADSERHGWLRGLIGMMHEEAERPGPGSAAIVASLSNAMFTVLLRVLTAGGQVSAGVLGLMADPRTARAVDAVVRDPAHPWTVDGLAATCHVSRATLLRRFAHAGFTPLELVSALRMERAARLLAEGAMSVSAVAGACGYVSQAAFGRVFAQHFGERPSDYRRRHRDARGHPIEESAA
ncbi:AraC family transcriptional regulator [Cupriavidus sp. 2SB]|uniref:cupin domain-containing protein n=1 Tax=Cupriavidus sp. 2SB TaxID=2502199 RepID=UPI0010F56A01|nr:AraC family transcriptional regulator [Cupriavidus sp. 2SB]